MSRSQVTAYLNVGDSLLDRLHREGKIPRPVRFGRRLLWDRHTLDVALDRLSGITRTPHEGNPSREATDEAMLRAIHANY